MIASVFKPYSIKCDELKTMNPISCVDRRIETKPAEILDAIIKWYDIWKKAQKMPTQIHGTENITMIWVDPLAISYVHSTFPTNVLELLQFKVDEFFFFEYYALKAWCASLKTEIKKKTNSQYYMFTENINRSLLKILAGAACTHKLSNRFISSGTDFICLLFCNEPHKNVKVPKKYSSIYCIDDIH